MNKLERIVNNHYSHYNHKKYWKMKFKLYDKKLPEILKIYYLCKLKKMDAFNSASLGNRSGGGQFLKEYLIFHMV